MGRAGAPEIKVLVAPGVAVEGSGIVAKLVSLAVMDANGTAVGFVTAKVNVRAVASVFVTLLVVVPEPEMPTALVVPLPVTLTEVVPELALTPEVVETEEEEVVEDAAEAEEAEDWP